MPPSPLNTFFEFFDLSWDGIAFVAPGPWRVVFANAALSEWVREPLENCPVDEVLSGMAPGQLRDKLEQAWRGEVDDSLVPARLIQRGDRLCYIPVDIRVVSVEFAEQRLVGMVIRKAEVADGKTAASRRDPLTGLADRSELLARLSKLLASERSSDQRWAVLFIDLNHFKIVNDQYGHLVGDRALSEVAHRLVQCTRESDHIYRYGGDEFVVLVEQVAGEYEIEPVIARIHRELAEPLEIRNEEVLISASIGVAEVSAAHRTPEDVLTVADQAMYAAKRLVPAIARR